MSPNEVYHRISLENKRKNKMIKTTTSYFDLEDGQLYYETAGEGIPLVLSHAAFLDSRMSMPFGTAGKAFPRDRYDMRGFGKSSPVTGPLSRRNDLGPSVDSPGRDSSTFVGMFPQRTDRSRSGSRTAPSVQIVNPGGLNPERLSTTR